MKAIQSELGEGNELAEEVRQFRGKARKAKMPKDVFKEVNRQLGKLERMHPDAAETATLRNYLECMVHLPWSKQSRDNLDLDQARAILDHDHSTGSIASKKNLEKDRVGVATGLAWTPTGGEILFVEAMVMKGKGELILTGTLGDVMRESARAALSFARSRAAEFNIDESRFSAHDIHIHIPEGAIPKDGPSAGVTMALAMISALTDTPIRRNVALTGEITLRGNVLPVGGVKSKILAARRAKIDTVVLPRINGKDVDELPSYVRRDIEFKLVDQVDEVLKAALVDHGKIFRIAKTPARISGRSSSSQTAGTAVK